MMTLMLLLAVDVLCCMVDVSHCDFVGSRAVRKQSALEVVEAGNIAVAAVGTVVRLVDKTVAFAVVPALALGMAVAVEYSMSQQATAEEEVVVVQPSLSPFCVASYRSRLS